MIAPPDFFPQIREERYIMRKCFKFIKLINKSMDVVGGSALVFIMLLTSLDVIVRYLGYPIQGSYDIVGLGGAVILGFALPRTSWDRGQITVDILTEKMSRKVNFVFAIFSRCASAFLFLLLGWNLANLGVSFHKTGEGTMMLGIPLYPIVYALMLCSFAEFLVLLLDIARICGVKEEQ